MMTFEKLLDAVSGEDPCGPNLEYDAKFLELERAARGRPEQQIGDTISAGEEPDWRDVEARASELLQRTKDLRVASHFSKSLLHTKGFPGFSDGLGLIKGLVEKYWGAVHPQLDPDDGNDPTMRVNVLMELCDAGVLSWVRTAPLVSAKLVGRFSLRDLAIATGEIPAPTKSDDGAPEPPTLQTIESAFLGAEISDLQATAAALKAASKHVQAIESITTDHVGAGNGPNLSKLRALLDQGAKAVDQRLTARGVGQEQEAAAAVDGVAGNGALSGPPAASRLAGEVSSREEVIKALDKICTYYDRYEPSSPLPLLLKRCRRLVNMSFLDIVRDIAPDALAQVEVLSGRDQQSEDAQ